MQYPVRDATPQDAEALKDFIRDAVDGAGIKGVVVGISGGVDSAVVVKLCADALGGDRVHAVFMPASTTPAKDGMQAQDMCREWGVRFSVIDVSSAVASFMPILAISDGDRVSRGNVTARCRMIVLFDLARKEKAIVVGTTNRSEYLMGYMTKFGDGAEDLMPLGTFYKTQVWQLASIIGVPQEIIDKVPTAGLWDGQSDEADMGISYAALDRILVAFDNGCDDEQAFMSSKVRIEKVADIRRRMDSSEHKRRPAVMPGVKGF